MRFILDQILVMLCLVTISSCQNGEEFFAKNGPLISGCKDIRYQEYLPSADTDDFSLCVTRLYNSRSVNIPITSDLLSDFSATINLVIDNSPSMVPSQNLIANGFNNFAQYFNGYDLFFNIHSTFSSDYQKNIAAASVTNILLQDPLNKNSIHRKLGKSFSPNELIDFSEGLKRDILIGTKQYEKETGLCALTRLAFEEDNPHLRPPGAAVADKVQVYMIISDENDYSAFSSCYKKVTSTPTGVNSTYYTQGSRKTVYVSYVRLVRNERISYAVRHEIKSQASLDYYNSLPASGSEACDATAEGFLPASAAGFIECKVQRSLQTQTTTKLNGIPDLCAGGGFSYDGKDYINLDEFMSTANAAAINSFNYQTSICKFTSTPTANSTVEYFKDDSGSHLDLGKVFVDKITARHGKANTIFLPIVFNPTKSGCSQTEAQYMEAGSKYLETMDYMKSDRGIVGSGKSASYDICGNDYAKFLKDNLGDYLKEVFGRLYKVPVTDGEIVEGVSIVEADGSTAILSTSKYAINITDSELSLDISTSISLNKDQSLRIGIKTPR